jgi:hypothetical protein
VSAMAGATASGAVGGRGPLAALVEGLVDYAGLFPPASLAMDDAVARYAADRAGPHRAMLGRFVLPAGRLDEFAVAGARHHAGEPWRLAAIATADEAPLVARFNAGQRGRFVVDAIEARAANVETIWAIGSAYDAAFTVHVELPAKDDPTVLIAELAARGLSAKIRTGGVTADAFPAPGEVLRFLGACARHGVAFKATAGLHHPLRGEYALTYDDGAPRATMYGFLNLFMAAALLYDGVDLVELVPLLDERDATAFRVEGDAISWRGRRVTSAEVARARERFASSFGSCSFDEPVRELAALALVPAASR